HYLAPTPPEVDAERLPVVVLEDNRETLLAYESYLRGTRYQLLPATRLSEGRDLLRRVRPVAVILDVLLHDENTWTLSTELTSNGERRGNPGIVGTGVDNEHKARALRADEFRVKPIDKDWLLATLQRVARKPEEATVLLIDDDEIDRYLMRGFLASTGFKLI